MSRNEAKRKLLRLFVPVIFLLIGAFSVQANAEDAFVVEEEAVIGGEGETEAAPPVAEPVQRSEISREPTEEKKIAPKKSKTGKKTEKEPESNEESNPVSVSENVISENEVSQNRVSSPFCTPVRKRVTKPEAEEADKKEEIKLREQVLPEESNPEELPKKSITWWLMFMGVAFFLCGCIRVVRRIGDRKKSNIRRE